MNVLDIRSKFLGGMLGSALGDAIGELAFHYPSKKALWTIIEKTDLLQYTDDTAMALGIAESLGERRTIDPHHVGETFRKNFEREPWRGYGPGPPTVFTLVRQGYSYQEAARRLFGGEGSYGNGSTMRITPIGLFFYNSKVLSKGATQSAEVTHAHPLAKDGAAILAHAIAMAVSQNPEEEFPIDHYLSELEKILFVEQLIHEKADQRYAARELGTNVTVHGSVPFAIFSFLKNTHSFEECLFHAIMIRGDRDTIGAMACGISGAFLGIENLPSEWLLKLENRGYIEELALRLVEKIQEP